MENYTYSQIIFCKHLMERLVEDILDADEYKTIWETTDGRKLYYLTNRTRMQNDIVRLRRELMKLSKMLEEGIKQ